MSEFKSGDKVAHELFGAGIVANVAGSGPDARITVDFAASIGRKKLLASVAKLQRAGEVQNGAAAAVTGTWVEVFEASARARHGRRVDADRIRESIAAEVVRTDFWYAVRDRLRAAGSIPKAIDDPSGRVFIRSTGTVTVQICVEHESLKDAQDAAAARAIFDELSTRALRDFESFTFTTRMRVGPVADEIGKVVLENPESTELPDREPRMRPKHVQPKGIFRSMPKRRDDY